mgnify:CR=1 FL=1
MKNTIILSAILIATMFQINAQQKVLLHSQGKVSQFSGANPLIAAYDSAQFGDTMYLSGGVFATPTLFNKKLYLFGAGFHLDSTQATNPSQISGQLNLGESSDYSIFEGIQFANNVQAAHNISASYLTFKRCKFNSYITFNGDITTNPAINNAFLECVVMGEAHLTNLTSSTFQNCFLQSIIVNTRSNLFRNNILAHNQPNSYTGGVLHSPFFNEFSNNIFLNAGYRFVYASNDGNIFNNNIFVYSSIDFGANAIVNNNYIGVNHADIFVNQSGYTYSFNHNYNLKNPSTYMGNDNTQVGIYGGIFPYKPGAVPSNPHISKSVISGTTDNSGDLEIEIEVNAQDK